MREKSAGVDGEGGRGGEEGERIERVLRRSSARERWKRREGRIRERGSGESHLEEGDGSDLMVVLGEKEGLGSMVMVRGEKTKRRNRPLDFLSESIARASCFVREGSFQKPLRLSFFTEPLPRTVLES